MTNFRASMWRGNPTAGYSKPQITERWGPRERRRDQTNLHSCLRPLGGSVCTKATLMIIPRAEGWIHRKRRRHETDATHWLRFPRVLCSVRRKGKKCEGGLHKQNNHTRIICHNWRWKITVIRNHGRPASDLLFIFINVGLVDWGK